MNDTTIAKNFKDYMMLQGKAGEILPELFDITV